MRMKQMFLAFIAALAIALAGPVAAQQLRSPFDAHSGSPDVANAAQITQPATNPRAQAATEQMLKSESAGLSGDYPVDRGDAAQLKTPVPNVQEQAATGRMLKNESAGLSGDYAVDRGDANEIQPPRPNHEAQRLTTTTLQQQNQGSGAITGQYD